MNDREDGVDDGSADCGELYHEVARNVFLFRSRMFSSCSKPSRGPPSIMDINNSSPRADVNSVHRAAYCIIHRKKDLSEPVAASALLCIRIVWSSADSKQFDRV